MPHQTIVLINSAFHSNLNVILSTRNLFIKSDVKFQHDCFLSKISPNQKCAVSLVVCKY